MLPAIAASCLHLDCHGSPKSKTKRNQGSVRSEFSSAATSISHALKVIQTVSVWSPIQPPASVALAASKQPTPNSNAASAPAEVRIVRFAASHAAAITVMKKVNQPRKLPVAIVAAPARLGATKRVVTAGKNKTTFSTTASA